MSIDEGGLRHRTALVLRGLRNSGMCVMYHDAALRVALVENAPAGWPDSDAILAGGDAAIFDPATAERLAATKRRVYETGEPARIEVALDPADGRLWYEIHIEPDAGSDGRRAGLFVSITDITLLKRREEALRALVYEVSHRSRNLLAIMQSILGHSARHSGTIAEFEHKFRGRIDSIARSQDLITYANWQGVRLMQLFHSQLAAFVSSGAQPPRYDGANPMLTPNAALYIGLAFHELAANSSAFGVIAAGAGAIEVTAGASGDRHHLIWTETLGRRDGKSLSGGFGLTVLEKVVPRALNGQSAFGITRGRLTYRIEWPAGHVIEPRLAGLNAG